MGRVLFRLRQPRAAGSELPAAVRRLVFLAATAALASTVYAGTAQASMCTSNCGGPVPVESGTISQTPATSTTTWGGMTYVGGATSDPSLCQPAYPEPIDTANGLCDHYELTPTAPGPVRVTVSWPDSMDTFWLVVCLNTPLGGVDTSMDDCPFGDVVAEDLNLNFANTNVDSVVFTPLPGTTYEVRVLPMSVVVSDYSGCAGYTSFNSCVPNPGGPPPPPNGTATCSSNPLTANVNRRINGGGDIADSGGNMKEHFSLSVAQKFKDNDDPLKGQVSYKNDGVLRFKSKQIMCATFYDEGMDANGHPNGSAEIRGQGTLRFDNGQMKDECFRAFARDTGEPGGSQDGGTDQFDIEFVDPTVDPLTQQRTCVFQGTLAGRVITKGNVDYHVQDA